jgi:hypothetical protein
MYIYQHRCFYDKSGIPWVRGTAIALLPFPQHAGFIDYTANGEQVILHKSKQRGRAVVTWPEEFDEGHIPYQVIRVPDAVGVRQLPGLRLASHYWPQRKPDEGFCSRGCRSCCAVLVFAWVDGPRSKTPRI